MRPGGKRRGVLIIGDTRAFGRVLRAMLGPNTKQLGPIRETTYEDCRGMLTPKVLRETALFVLELWRNYPTGLRAEGVAVADQLMKLGAPALIVSPLSLGGEIGATYYWDLASKDRLCERCVGILGGRDVWAVKKKEGIEELKRLLDEYLAKPAGHEDSE